VTRAEIARALLPKLPRSSDALVDAEDRWGVEQDWQLVMLLSLGGPWWRVAERMYTYRPGTSVKACKRRWERLQERAR
jgi:hypothetical protein